MREVIFLLSLLAYLASPAQDSSSYTVYYSNRNAGLIKIKREQNGLNYIHYTLNDRGRGSDHHYIIQTNAEKGFDRFGLSGVNLAYTADSVTRNTFRQGNLFYTVQGKDTVKSNFKSSGLIDYVNNAWAHEFFFPIITDTSIHGEQRYEYKKILEKTFITSNNKINAQLYNISQKQTDDIFLIWLSANHRLLAQVSRWNDWIENGKEELRKEIRKINDSVWYAHLEQSSAATLRKSIENFALVGGNIVDIEKGILIANQTILVSNGKIEQLGDSASVIIPRDYRIINTSGKTVMPGLWDMHAHYSPTFGRQYLANGITSVRDLGNNLDSKKVQQKIDDGKLVGPGIAWLCGFIDMNGDMAGPCGIFIDNLEQGIEAIRTYHQLGYQSIKLYSSIKPSYVKPLAAEAHKLGMPVHGHIPAFMTAEEAILDGYDEINHLNMLILGHFGKTLDTRTRLRLSLMRERAFETSPYSEYGQRLIALMKKEKTILDPTSVLFYRPVTLREGSTKRDSIDKACVDTISSWLKVLYQNGISFIPGTDAPSGNGLITELKNYTMIGMSNADALRSATLWSAQYCKLDKQLGTVSPGKIADLIILSGNPLESIGVLDKIDMVISKGKLFNTRDLRPSPAPGNANNALTSE